MTTKRMTKATATQQLIDYVCGAAVNEDDAHSKWFDKMVKKIEKRVGEKNVATEPEFLAYISGLSAGSTAVARRWIEREPKSAVAYVATEKLRKLTAAA